jgi:hypothetical protein
MSGAGITRASRRETGDVGPERPDPQGQERK